MSTVDASGAIHGSDGKFAGHVAGEADSSVTLGDPVPDQPDAAVDPGGTSHDHVVLTQRCRTAQRVLRDARMDPRTGGTPPHIVGGVDIANTPVEDWPDSVRSGVGNLGLGLSLTTQRPALEAMLRDVEAHEAAGGRIEVITDKRSRQVVRWTRDGRPWRDTSGCRQMGVPVEFTDRTPTAVLTPDGNLVKAALRDQGMLSHTDPDGTITSFYPLTGTQWSVDEERRPHRTDGPAYLGDRTIEYLRRGITHREADQGPAIVGYDGRVDYVEFGAGVQPTEDQMARHNVVRAEDGSLRLNGFHHDEGDRLLSWYNRGFIV